MPFFFKQSIIPSFFPIKNPQFLSTSLKLDFIWCLGAKKLLLENPNPPWEEGEWRSRRLRTSTADKLHFPNAEMGWWKRPKNCQFFVMLKSPLLCFPALEGFMNSPALGINNDLSLCVSGFIDFWILVFFVCLSCCLLLGGFEFFDC